MMRSARSAFVVAVIGTLMAGCGGGNGSAPATVVAPARTGPATVPAPAPSAITQYRTAAPLSVVVHLPKRHATGAAKYGRAPLYLSPSATTLAVTINPAGSDGPTTNGPCINGTCTATLGLPILSNGQTVTVTIALTDGTSTLAKGSASLVFGTDYAIGTAASISPTLDAVATQISVSEYFQSITQGQAGTFTVAVRFLDADNNDIGVYYSGNPAQRIVDSAGDFLADESGAASPITVTSTDGNFTFSPVNFLGGESNFFESTVTYNGAFGSSSVTYVPMLPNGFPNPALLQLNGSTSTFTPAGTTFSAATLASSGDYQFIAGPPSTLEIANVAAHSGGSVTLQSNYASTIKYSITSDTCTYPGNGTVIDTAFANAIVATQSTPVGSSATFPLNELAQSVPTTCSITVQDQNGTSAQLDIAVDKTTITVNGKARKK